MNAREKAVLHNVAPAILANACVFLFSVVDGIWHTFGIYEALVLVLAVALKKASERRGVVYQ